jgi:hypothetical protein
LIRLIFLFITQINKKNFNKHKQKFCLEIYFLIIHLLRGTQPELAEIVQKEFESRELLPFSYNWDLEKIPLTYEELVCVLCLFVVCLSINCLCRLNVIHKSNQIIWQFY